jgi:hypothetical protein
MKVFIPLISVSLLLEKVEKHLSKTVPCVKKNPWV